MLKLENITKVYKTKDNEVHALNGISLEFRKSEFVAILGPSGCGKTTLLNIIGGLDQYTSGDLIIDSKSTKDFMDNDWDSYRNHSIGFVFQNYNLISHQTVLKNVELALTLSGVSAKERYLKAKEALERVGLGEKLNKKPNQLSGGQMQRVAIARSLVNNPEILLADEPTGALDSQTSIQVMDILKEIAKDRLVIMVTHNPELAEKYATRIIKLSDGVVIDDSDPYTIPNFEKLSLTKKEKRKEKRKKKVSMSFFTALSLSLNNLFTKKARTLMVSLAGSIGIIGIALIFSVSNGFQNYIDQVQQDTLSTYPLTVSETTVDMTTLVENMAGKSSGGEDNTLDKVYSNDIMLELFSTVMAQAYTNDLKDFKKAVDEDTELQSKLSSVKYSYDIKMNIYSSDTSNILQVNPSDLFSSMMGGQSGSTSSMYSSYSMDIWQEMLDNQELLSSQYDLIYGSWPEKENEIVLVVDKYNQISDYALYSLGIKDPAELTQIMVSIMTGSEYTTTQTSYSYEDICSNTFKLVLECDYYQKDETTGKYVSIKEDTEKLKKVIENGLDIKISGIIRPNETVSATSISSPIGYTHALTEYVINKTNESDVVKEQIEKPYQDIFTGLPFANENLNEEYLNTYIDSLTSPLKEEMEEMKNELGVEGFIAYINSQTATCSSNLSKLSSVDLDKPSMISFYPIDFESKEDVVKFIEDYNKEATKDDPTKEIRYTDYIGILLSSVSTIVDAVSYVLIAFVSISLVVSSIMIGVITSISVLERTKEIGILRSIGASKKDISRVFNAETILIGLASGVLGVLLTLVLCIPINLIINSLASIGNIAKLPLYASLILIAISVLLTLVAGLIPSSKAAKKDPVEALRTE